MYENSNIKIIGLCETWLDDSNKDLYKINGYNSVHVNRNNNRGGGVSLFIRSNISYTLRSDLSAKFVQAESVVIEIELNNKHVIIGEIYRPPHTNIPSFIENLNDILSAVDIDNLECYLMGDMNIDCMKCT